MFCECDVNAMWKDCLVENGFTWWTWNTWHILMLRAKKSSSIKLQMTMTVNVRREFSLYFHFDASFMVRKAYVIHSNSVKSFFIYSFFTAIVQLRTKEKNKRWEIKMSFLYSFITFLMVKVILPLLCFAGLTVNMFCDCSKMDVDL